MTYNRTGRAARGAFTLVEILVVILIIALLVSLTAAGLVKILGQGPQLKTASDIRQFDVAFQQFFNEFPSVNYVPSLIILREDSQYYVGGNPASGVLPRYANTVTYLRRLFGKNINLLPATPGPVTSQNGPGIDWTGDGTIDNVDHVLEGQHCLVFWLGGIPAPPGGPPGVLGFSTNPYNPASNVGTRRGPFFQNWESKRLVLQQDPTKSGYLFYTYLDAWPVAVNRPAMPYAFFSAYGVQNGYKNAWGGATSDCPSLGLLPYVAANGTYANPNTYQIISAGKDGQFGTGGLWNPVAGGNPLVPAGQDNQSNFAKGILEAGQ